MYFSKDIQITDYNYNLPENRIAKYPLQERDASKLLLYKGGKIEETIFTELPTQLPEESLLVFNTTKVIKARLQFPKKTGAIIEVFCLEPYLPNDYATSLQSKAFCQWKCLIGNLKRWKTPKLSLSIPFEKNSCEFTAEIVEKVQDAFIIKFEWDKPITFSEILTLSGAIPIPPYLNRKSETIDNKRYQTVFSQVEGSVAAPTAGLHFTSKLIENLTKQRIQTTELTLHVGAGTFKPVKSTTIGEHYMHTEVFSFSVSLIDSLLANDIIVAVGTTVVRSLESIYQIGRKLLLNYESPLHISQWEAYEMPLHSKKDALYAVKTYMKDLGVTSLTAKTDIMIAPGYDFKIVTAMLTNFHQPQSTLLLLVSAFIGDWRAVYDYALANDFRFLSYGDSSLLFRV